MNGSFQVQDLIEQTSGVTVYRALGKDGSSLRLTRLSLEDEAVASLKAGQVFEQALAKLKSLEHDFLCRVIDGGMDEEDGSPWVTGLWMEGRPLSEGKIEEKEIRSLGKQFHQLLDDLGDDARALDFDPDHILTRRSDDGELHCVFEIDYQCWFEDWSSGRPPGLGRNAIDGVRTLMKGLAIRQLQMPRKVEEKPPIPFVDERSPALALYEPKQDRKLGRVLVWLLLLASLGVIAWLTWAGTRRAEDPSLRQGESGSPAGSVK